MTNRGNRAFAYAMRLETYIDVSSIDETMPIPREYDEMPLDDLVEDEILTEAQERRSFRPARRNDGLANLGDDNRGDDWDIMTHLSHL